MKKIWLRDVAEAAGVSVSAASHAVNRTGTLAEATRTRILKQAEKLGYERDPVLSEIAARRFRQTKAKDYLPVAVMSVVTGNERLREMKEFPLHLARKVGRRFGIRLLDPVIVESVKEGERRLGRWYRRGVEGVLIGTAENATLFASQALNPFTVLGIGDIPVPFPFHKVETDWGHSVRICYEKLWAAGCRKIGITLIGKKDPTYQDKVRLGAFLSEGQLREGAEPVPPLFLDPPAKPGEVWEWYATHRPDGWITWPLHPLYHLMEAGVRIPGDLKVALLHIGKEIQWNKDMAGMCGNPEQLMEQRMRLFHDQLRHTEKGRPPYPLTHRIQMRWRDGWTLP